MACIILHLFGFDRSNLFCVKGNKTVEILRADVVSIVCSYCICKTLNALFLPFLSRYSRVSRKHQELQNPSNCRSQCESHIKVSTAHSCVIAFQPQLTTFFLVLIILDLQQLYQALRE